MSAEENKTELTPEEKWRRCEYCIALNKMGEMVDNIVSTYNLDCDLPPLSQEMEELFDDARKRLDKAIYSFTGFSIIAGDFVSADYYREKRE